MLCYMRGKRCEKESQHPMNFATFYFRLLSVKDWLKTKQNFERYILAGC